MFEDFTALKTAALLCMVVFLINAQVMAKSYVYLERTAGNNLNAITRTITVASSAGGYHITNETPAERMECEVTDDFSITTMHYVNKSTKTDISLVRDADAISVDGISGKEPVKISIPLNPRASWQQEWIAGVNNFSLSAESEKKICALRLGGKFRYGEFIAMKLPDEMLTYKNVSIPVRRVVIKLSGVAGRIMNLDTHFWISKRDGIVVKSSMPRGPGMPLTITELIHVRD